MTALSVELADENKPDPSRYLAGIVMKNALWDSRVCIDDAGVVR